MSFDDLLNPLNELSSLFEERIKQIKNKNEIIALKIELAIVDRWRKAIDKDRNDINKMKSITSEIKGITRALEGCYDWAEANDLVNKIWHINECLLSQYDWDAPGVIFRPGAEYPK